MSFVDALRSCADERPHVYQEAEEGTAVTDFEAGRQLGYCQALDDLEAVLLEDFAMPPAAVAVYIAAMRERGEPA